MKKYSRSTIIGERCTAPTHLFGCVVLENNGNTCKYCLQSIHWYRCSAMSKPKAFNPYSKELEGPHECQEYKNFDRMISARAESQLKNEEHIPNIPLTRRTLDRIEQIKSELRKEALSRRLLKLIERSEDDKEYDRELEKQARAIRKSASSEQFEDELPESERYE